MTIGKFRGFLYRFARLLGDATAVSKGPKATAKRVGRRGAGKVTARLLRRLFR